MKLVIENEVSRQLPDGLGFAQSQARLIVGKPDDQHEIRANGKGVARLYVKRFPSFVDLVMTRDQFQDRIVSFAFRAFRDLTPLPIDQMPPLELLETAVQRFGVDIRVANETGRFFLNRIVDSTKEPQGQVAEVFDFQHRPGNAYSTHVFFRPIEGENKMHLALVFSFSMTDYAEWVKSQPPQR